MTRRTLLVASLALTSGCGMLGGGGGGGQPEQAPAPQAAPAPAARAPSASEPWSPADPPPRRVPQMAPAPTPAPTPAPAAATPAAAPSAQAPAAEAPVQPAPAEAAAAQRTPSLYTRLGGLSAVRSVVDTMLARVMADARINAFFRGVNMDSLRMNLVEQICDAAGGPCTYRGRPMPEAHRGLNLTNAHFDALIEDLVASLNAHGVPEREKTELVTVLGRMRGDVVGK